MGLSTTDREFVREALTEYEARKAELFHQFNRDQAGSVDVAAAVGEHDEVLQTRLSSVLSRDRMEALRNRGRQAQAEFDLQVERDERAFQEGAESSDTFETETPIVAPHIGKETLGSAA